MGGWGPLIVAGVVAGPVIESRAQVAVTPVTGCRFDVVGSGRVTRIVDGRSFVLRDDVLRDDREVRLAAIEVPLAADAASPRALVSRNAAEALGAMLAGREIELRQREAVTDRYGRTVAHAYFAGEGGE